MRGQAGHLMVVEADAVSAGARICRRAGRGEVISHGSVNIAGKGPRADCVDSQLEGTKHVRYYLRRPASGVDEIRVAGVTPVPVDSGGDVGEHSAVTGQRH